MIIINRLPNAPTLVAPAGTYGFISYTRLIELLSRSGGEFKSDEVVTHLIIETGGVRYRVETK